MLESIARYEYCLGLFYQRLSLRVEWELSRVLHQLALDEAAHSRGWYELLGISPPMSSRGLKRGWDITSDGVFLNGFSRKMGWVRWVLGDRAAGELPIVDILACLFWAELVDWVMYQGLSLSPNREIRRRARQIARDEGRHFLLLGRWVRWDKAAYWGLRIMVGVGMMIVNREYEF